MTRSGTLEEIYEVSKKAVDIFRSYGLKCCLFGSAACALYGVERTPNVSHRSSIHKQFARRTC